MRIRDLRLKSPIVMMITPSSIDQAMGQSSSTQVSNFFLSAIDTTIQACSTAP